MMTDAIQKTPAATTRSRAWWRPVLLMSVIVLILILVWRFNLASTLGALRDWIDGLGPWGPVVFILVYVGATIAAIPGIALTIAAGAIFGTVLGTICVSIGSTVGAALCFLIARYIARDATKEWPGRSRKLQRLDELTEQHGEAVVAITRLAPLFPFSLLNYGFGLTRVRFWTYVFYSWLCMLPATVIYVAGADAIVKAVMQRRAPLALIVAVAIMIVILALVVRSAWRKLKSNGTVAEAGAERPEGSQGG